VNAPVRIACVLTGDRISKTYVDRLHSMLERHCEEDFTLSCFTDRTRNLQPEIKQVDLSDWQLETWFNKLRLLAEPPPFLYLDVTMVIKSSIAPLFQFGRASNEDLVLVQDWHYDSYNTSVMWVNGGQLPGQIWEAFREGKRYETRLDTDQDFLTSFIREFNLQHKVSTLPDGMVQSYKKLLNVHAKDPAAARAKLNDATIIKFHGEPRPHQVLGSSYWIKRALKYPSRIKADYRYLVEEIKEWWR
jgi:hypothetical protein